MKKKVFILCIEIDKPSDIQRVDSIISTHIAERYVMVMNNVYVVTARDSNATCQSIRGCLTTFLPGFQLFIMQTSANAAWRVSQDVDVKLNSIL